MGCRGLFNGCADGSDLSSALVAVPLGLNPGEEGVSLVYIARSVGHENSVDGEIVRIPTDDLDQYRNSNLFQADQLTNEGIVDYMNHTMTEALVTIQMEGTEAGVENFRSYDEIFSRPDDVPTAATKLAYGESFDSIGQIRVALSEARSLAEAAAQEANHGNIPEERIIAGYSNDEMQMIISNWADAANDTVDRLARAEDMFHIRGDLIEQIHGFEGFDAARVNALQDIVMNGIGDGEVNKYDHDHSNNMGQTMTMVPGN